MFFLRLIGKSVTRQARRRLLISLTVALAAAVSIAMLGIVYDVGDKLTNELSAYGSNITVRPKSDALISELYGSSSSNTPSSSTVDPSSFIKESDLQKIKTIFWAYNITNFAPQLNVRLTVQNHKTGIKESRIPVVGTWFNKQVHVSTGETTLVGVQKMRPWWKIQGSWPKDSQSEAMVGSALAAKLGISVGDRVTISSQKKLSGRVGKSESTRSTGSTESTGLTGSHDSGSDSVNGSSTTSHNLKVVGIYSSHDDDDQALYTSTSCAQAVSGLQDKVDYVEVKALTTPENDLARKAAKNPDALSQEEWETWYCTAYPSSIAYQIQEVLPNAVAKQVRQVAALEGNVLAKTRSVMIVMTALTLIAATIAVANLMSAALGERASQLALLKALGARNSQIFRLIISETALIAALGAMTGSLLGVGLAQIVSRVVFHSSITMRPMVFVLVFVLLTLTVLAASVSSIRQILKLQPAQVLHGR